MFKYQKLRLLVIDVTIQRNLYLMGVYSYGGNEGMYCYCITSCLSYY